MIKFRYKRKEPTNNGGSTSSGLIKNNNNKNDEIKSNDGKDDNKQNLMKCETKDTKPSPQIVKAKTTSEQEYMEDCIRAIVVSLTRFFSFFFCSTGYFFSRTIMFLRPFEYAL